MSLTATVSSASKLTPYTAWLRARHAASRPLHSPPWFISTKLSEASCKVRATYGVVDANHLTFCRPDAVRLWLSRSMRACAHHHLGMGRDRKRSRSLGDGARWLDCQFCEHGGGKCTLERRPSEKCPAFLGVAAVFSTLSEQKCLRGGIVRLVTER